MGIAWAVGQKISATRLNRRNPVTATKESDESKTSTTTPTDDAFLSVTLKANTIYDVFGCLMISDAADAVGDFLYQWSWTGTAVLTRGSIGPANGLGSGTQGAGDWGVGLQDSFSPGGGSSWGATNGANNGVRVNDRFEVGNADIQATIQWSQNVSDADATILRAGSWITAVPVG